MKSPDREIDREIGPSERKSVIQSLIELGVEVIDPDQTYVGRDVEVAPGCVLFPGTHLRGSTTIGPGCRIGPDCWIEDSTIEAGCLIRYSVIEQARVRERSTVGPYAHVRHGSDIGPEVRIGNFVETKSARLERGVKAGHVSYIGDAEIGEDVNIGAGTITCNYDGRSKHRTIIERGAFIGSNAALVAPVTVGEGAFVAAGSTITDDVPPSVLAFGRARQVNKTASQSAEEEHADDR